MVRVWFLILIYGVLYYAQAASRANFGPFTLVLKKMVLAKGPKSRDCSINSGSILNDTYLHFQMNITEDVKDVHGNLLAISESKQTLRFLMKKLCDHSFWLPFMSQFLNITKDCVILKGNYTIKVNTEELAKKYYGGSFFYGKWTTKAIYYNNVCNVGYTSVMMDIIPK